MTTPFPDVAIQAFVDLGFHPSHFESNSPFVDHPSLSGMYVECIETDRKQGLRNRFAIGFNNPQYRSIHEFRRMIIDTRCRGWPRRLSTYVAAATFKRQDMKCQQEEKDLIRKRARQAAEAKIREVCGVTPSQTRGLFQIHFNNETGVIQRIEQRYGVFLRMDKALHNLSVDDQLAKVGRVIMVLVAEGFISEEDDHTFF